MSGTTRTEKRAKARRKIALSGPRREAKKLDGFLRNVLPASVPGYSRALLGRALAEFELRSRPFSARVTGPAVFVFIIPAQLIAVAWFEGAGWAASGFLLAAYFLTAFSFASIATARQNRRNSGERKRIRQLVSKERFLAIEEEGRSVLPTLLVFVLLLGIIVFYLAYSLEKDEMIPLSIRATAGFVWGALLIFLGSLFSRYLLVRSATQMMLVRLLASACGTLMVASPAQWRSADYRRTATTTLGAAAAIVEGPALRILAGIPLPSRTPEWRQVRDSAAALRRLAARVVTRGPDSWPEIGRSVAFALATAVAGALVHVESDSPPEDDAAVASRLGRLLHGARNLVIAFLPAIGVGAVILGGDRYGWEWAQQTRPVLIQFAIVSVLIGLMSALDPSGYQQRLNAITGAGGSIFGRRG
jgi:hypothetical protein